MSVFLVSALPVWADTALDSVIERYENFQTETSPYARARAEGKVMDQWPDVSPEANASYLAGLKSIRAELNAVDVAGLSEEDLLNYQVLDAILEGDIALGGFDEARLPFTGDSGFHSSVSFAVSQSRIKDADSAEATIALIEGIPDYLDSEIANMRRGMASGFVSYKDPLETVIAAIDQMSSVASPEESELFAPFETLPKYLTEDHKTDIETRAKAAIIRAIEAFSNVNTFLKTDYAPLAREKAGIVDLPGSRAYYQAVLTYHTTLPDLTPEDVHDMGQAEVARIRAEMDEVIRETGFEGSFVEFLVFLRTDPQFYANSADELMMIAARLAKDIDYKMPAFFGHLPRLPYGVEPVPESIAPGYTTGRYVSGSLKDGRAGIYWVNTYAIEKRPLYQLAALTAHEAVPGHHHQISIAQELDNVPEFRKNYYATAFGEGWGLYAESLVEEMGLYDTPYEKFGKLSYEMWRACRLVADTGLHWYGWSREEAEACFVENSALNPHNIQTEVTRYIGWPGQALGYKIGELKIKELRARAEKALGSDFDICEFHDTLLEKGSLPLSVLEARMDAWIAEELGD